MDNPQQSKSRLPYFLVATGVVCILLGITWKHLLPKSAIWSEQQAAEYQEAYHLAHEASIGPGHYHGPGEQPHQPLDLEAAKARFKQSHQQLEKARSVRDSTGKWLTGAGVVMSVAGALLLRSRQAS